MGSRDTEISINTWSVVRALLVFVVAALIFALRDLVLILITSIVIASAVEPLVEWFLRRGVARTLSVLLIYLVALVAIVGVVYFVLPPIVSDVTILSQSLPARIASLGDLAGSSDLPFSTYTGNWVRSLTPQDVLTLFRETVPGVGGSVLQTASLFFGGIVSFVLILVLSFYLSVQKDGVENFLRVVTPVKHERYILDLWRRSQSKIGLWMQGQLFLGFFIAVFVYLGLALIGVRYALSLAILAGVLELVPYAGPILSAVPAVLLGFGDGVTTGIIVLCFYIIIQQFENHLLYPLVVKKMVGVPALLVIISMIVGGRLAGFLGIVIAVPIAAIIMELVGDWEKRKHVFAERNGS